MQPTLLSKGINLKRFKDIALKHCPTLYDEINEYQPKDIPEKPEEMDSFYRLNKAARKRESAGFFSKDYIKKYLDAKWTAEVYNQSCFIRLWELYTGVNYKFETWEISDSDKLSIKQKMNMFYNKIISNKKPFKALIMDFKEYGYSNKITEHQQAMDEINNGWEE